MQTIIIHTHKKKEELLNEAHTHTQAGKKINCKRRKSKCGTEDLDLLWMERGIALCLPVDFKMFFLKMFFFKDVVQLTHLFFVFLFFFFVIS